MTDEAIEQARNSFHAFSSCLGFPRDTTDEASARTVWELAHNPDLAINVLFPNMREAERFSLTVTRHLRGVLVQKIFPHLELEDGYSCRRFRIRNSAQYSGVVVTTFHDQNLGRRFDLVISVDHSRFLALRDNARVVCLESPPR